MYHKLCALVSIISCVCMAPDVGDGVIPRTLNPFRHSFGKHNLAALVRTIGDSSRQQARGMMQSARINSVKPIAVEKVKAHHINNENNA